MSHHEPKEPYEYTTNFHRNAAKSAQKKNLAKAKALKKASKLAPK